jgi:hypothetical protein
MRLRGEGHEQLHVLGPQGANAGSQQACNFPQTGACFLLQCPPMRLRACTSAWLCVPWRRMIPACCPPPLCPYRLSPLSHPQTRAGTQAAVCSLRHFIHWRHPAVLLEEVAPWEQPTVYQASR